MERYIEPKKIIDSKNCETPDALLDTNPIQINNYFKGSRTIIRQGGYVLLDFGKEIHGSVVIATYMVSHKPVKGRIVYGESVMEALSFLGEKNARNDHSIRDMVVDFMPMSTQPYGETGFRFVKVEAIDGDLTIRAIKASPKIRDLTYYGSFECSDKRLNDIWKTGAYTVQLNMHDYIWDGIKRDRLVWIGDMHPEVSTIRYVFGKDHSVPRSLDFVRDITPDNDWMNGMPSYNMWWIIIHYDWYMHWGDKSYLKEQLPYLKKTVKMAFDWIDSGYVCPPNFEVFVDWSTKGDLCEMDGLKTMFAMGIQKASLIFDIFNETDFRDKCQIYSEKLKNETQTRNLNKRVAGLMVLSEKTSDDAIKILDDSANEMSCFMGYYVLLAKAKLGQTNGALKIIREFWGAMLDMGATTFWEDFDINWIANSSPIDQITPPGMNDIHGDFGKYCYQKFRHSLCHGWASGPTAFLSEKIAGMTIIEPGCKKVMFSPNLAGLEWANITVPTPYGNIEIKLKNKNGSVETQIIAPEEIEWSVSE